MKLSMTILFLFFIGLVTPGFNYSYSTDPGKENPCLECHGDLLQMEYKHGPAENACDNCHKPTGKEHPGDEKGFELIVKIQELCITCHEGLTNQKVVHTPARNGNCTGCHSPHASSFKKLLITDKKKICLNCHNKSVSADSKPVINMAELVENRKYLHAALTGGCMTCHLSHTSDFPKLLNAAFPAGNYSPAIKDSFDLCFQCHDTDLLEKELTTTATNFRNGDKNLHFIHIRGAKGRSCIMCHDVHGSNYEHLIADKIPFGKWNIPIIYKLSESGGSCKTGCHAERSYIR
jgi:predicted CXXCH cytochrome family protein